MGLRALPVGPGCQVASGGTGLEPTELGSGDRMQGLCHCLNWEQGLRGPGSGN